jgi:hypothetical protein
MTIDQTAYMEVCILLALITYVYHNARFDKT